jgi:hypothetical protein
VGCCHAIYALRRTVDYFNSAGSMVNLCSLDISKAFDSVSHDKLFLKLMRIKLPKGVIDVLVNWYGKLSAVVKWGNSYSNSFGISSGVRQGGVLSPV